MRLESGELRIFHTLAKVGGFRSAANELHLTQSAVSQSIKQLEAKLGQTLVLRQRPIKLSAAGRRLFHYADEQLRQEQLVLEDIDRLSQGANQELSVAIDSTNNRFAGPDLVALFSQQWPQTRLRIIEQPSRSIVQSVLNGEVELGLGPFETRMAQFERIAIYEENRRLLISPQHRLHQQPLSNSQLGRIPLVVSSLDEPDQRPYPDKLRDHFQMIWQISSLNLRLSLIDRGLAVGYISDRVIAELPQLQHLRPLDEFPFASIERQVGIFFVKGHSLSPAALDFIGVCKDYWH
ncbi:LysR family transcriptional regulator [Gallaecimonas sp. GXIMD1310]|uniref:LysR family transcriptional regulator n=1 Tax=Gallaecimonas sp. GXIMD1310 TaxID=3131926 RepID=UPI00324A7CB3